MRTLLYQGSVKNLFQREGNLEFEFTDQYSIFDWGVMPDLIKDKGSNLAQMATFFFEKIQDPNSFKSLFENISMEALYFSSEDIKVYKDNLIKNGGETHFIQYLPPRSIEVKKVEILRPSFKKNEYLYPEEMRSINNALIPLEVIFRFGAPSGSSYIKRNPDTKAGEFFEEIKVEFFTKLEPQDRLLSTEEAINISGLSANEFNELVFKTKSYALLLKNIFREKDITLWDGKFEFAYGTNREITLVDSIGADELRLSYKNLPLSKEFLRKIYRKTIWYKELKIAKLKYPNDFKEKINSTPRKMFSDELFGSFLIYKELVKSLIENKKFFCPNLELIHNNMFKNIALFGKGGREHALAINLANDPQVEKVHIFPGNPGMKHEKITCNDSSEDDYIKECKRLYIDFAVIGPEALLEKGLVNELEAAGIRCASPSKEAALLESSKAFSKKFMNKYNIPTAEYRTFTDTASALEFVKTCEHQQFVVKLSGLAAGKGVILCYSKEEAEKAVLKLAPDNEEIIIEDLLIGKELSYFALCCEDSFTKLGTACDYKRLFDEDKGPNTGGMGCYSPAFWMDELLEQEIVQRILKPTLNGLKKEGIMFKGTLFIGLMVTNRGPIVLEYNTRFGDPETQTILPRLEFPLTSVLKAIAVKNKEMIEQTKIYFKAPYSIHIVKAAKGYPGTNGENIEKHKEIVLKDDLLPQSTLFFAGVEKENNILRTNGGRVLGITSFGIDLKTARENAYHDVQKIEFSGQQYRKDIGLC